MKCTKSILTAVLLAYVQAGMTVFSADFIYNYQTVFDNNADTYIVGEQNVSKYSEWQNPPVTYWGPSANDVPGVLTMEFNFSAPTAQIFLNANLEASNNGFRGDYGYCSLWASTDGASWQLLLNDPEPTTPDTGPTVYYDQNVPISLLGGTNFWLQVRMQAHDVPANNFTDAQFSRYDPANPPASGQVFDLEVTLVPEPGCLSVLSCGIVTAFFCIKRIGRPSQ